MFRAVSLENKGTTLDGKSENAELVFQIYFSGLPHLSFRAEAKLRFFQSFRPRNVSKSSFFQKQTNFFLFSQGRVEIFFHPEGWALLSRGRVRILVVPRNKAQPSG